VNLALRALFAGAVAGDVVGLAGGCGTILNDPVRGGGVFWGLRDRSRRLENLDSHFADKGFLAPGFRNRAYQK
jgi:hypothetical protein